MKKFYIFWGLVFLQIFLNLNAIAEEITTMEEVPPPKWEDYVEEKYHNPRSDFKRKTAYTEMAIGFVLTDLIITAPIGIPLIVHSATKVKHLSNFEKKKKFEKGLLYAESIKDPELKKDYYKTLIKDCKLSERKKSKLHKRKIKQLEKEKKKSQKELKDKTNLENQLQNI